MTPQEKAAKKAAYMKEWHAKRMADPEKRRQVLNRQYELERKRLQNPDYANKVSQQRLAKREELRAKDPEAYDRKMRERAQARRLRKKVEGDPDRNAPQLKWSAANRDKINARRNQRYKEDPAYRLLQCLRSRLRSAFKNTGAPKESTCRALTGCTLEQLHAHIEAQFTEGMTWENYGEWHVDHKRACCLFDLTDPAQAKECFHYTNLQPLWALDNWVKAGSDRAALKETNRHVILASS